MSPQAAAGASIQIERRRSNRLAVHMVVVVCGDAGRLQEQTSTSSLSAHGIPVWLGASLKIGQKLIIQNPENWAERGGRVTRLGQSCAGRTEVGIEFTEPAPDFWLIPAGSKRVD
jgi:hypothetical protein